MACGKFHAVPPLVFWALTHAAGAQEAAVASRGGVLLMDTFHQQTATQPFYALVHRMVLS